MHPVRHVFHFTIILLVAYLAPGSIVRSDANDSFSRELIAGKTLLNFCTGKYDTDLGLCNGYIMAVAEAMTSEQPVFGQRACGHAGIKAQQLVELVRMEAGEMPQMQTQPAGVMVASVLSNAFPCYDDYEPASGASSGTGYHSRAVTAEPLSAPIR